MEKVHLVEGVSVHPREGLGVDNHVPLYEVLQVILHKIPELLRVRDHNASLFYSEVL